VEPGGVDEYPEGSVALALALAACFAAFSARRFCFDAEGGIAMGRTKMSRLDGEKSVDLNPNPVLGAN
jgi:hypothetical protein